MQLREGNLFIKSAILNGIIVTNKLTQANELHTYIKVLRLHKCAYI